MSTITPAHLPKVKHHKGQLRQQLYDPDLEEVRFEAGVGVMMDSLFGEPILIRLEAPFRWRHAGLSSLADFLKGEIQAGRYRPIVTGGLD